MKWRLNNWDTIIIIIIIIIIIMKVIHGDTGKKLPPIID